MPLLYAVAVLLALVGSPGPAHACDPWQGLCDTPSVGASHTGSARAYGGRPAGCPRVLWCGCFAAVEFLRIPAQEAKRRGLWLARNWAREGLPAAGPAPGVIAVYRRGRRGGHVGKVLAVPRPGVVVLKSGNDGGAVRIRERSTQGVIAWRRL